jgi:hypothetical protein
MKRTILLIGILALAFPATAAAKGPSGASIEGPGIGEINFTNSDGLAPGTELGDLTTWSGFFPAVFRQTPDPMFDKRPEGDLGPKYTVT